MRTAIILLAVLAAAQVQAVDWITSNVSPAKAAASSQGCTTKVPPIDMELFREVAKTLSATERNDIRKILDECEEKTCFGVATNSLATFEVKDATGKPTGLVARQIYCETDDSQRSNIQDESETKAVAPANLPTNTIRLISQSYGVTNDPSAMHLPENTWYRNQKLEELAFHCFPFAIKGLPFLIGIHTINAQPDDSQKLQEQSRLVAPIWRFRLLFCGAVIGIVLAWRGWWNIRWQSRFCGYGWRNFVFDMIFLLIGFGLFFSCLFRILP